MSSMPRKSRWKTIRWLAIALVCMVALLALRAFSAPRLSPRAQLAADMLKRQHIWRQAVRDGDVPKLSNWLAPWGPAWRNSIALCSTVRQENTTDLREWLMHYRCVTLTDLRWMMNNSFGLTVEVECASICKAHYSPQALQCKVHVR